MVKHLTDEEVQQFAVDKLKGEKKIAEHVYLCEECKAKVEVYKLLITGIKQQPQPVFDFDLSASVLNQLPAMQPETGSQKFITWMLIFVSAAFLAGGAYYFRGYITSMFEGVATILIFLIGISVITVIAALVFDMYRKYRKEMKVLDLY